MIKFHYFEWPASAFRRRGLPIGRNAEGMVRCCHVYSDESVEELQAWGRQNGLGASWLQGGKARLPHFDLWGRRLRLCGPGITDRTFVDDLRAWRKKRAAPVATTGHPGESAPVRRLVRHSRTGRAISRSQ